MSGDVTFRIARRTFVGALMACCVSAFAPLAFAQTESALPAAKDALSGPALLDALRRGGYVIYIRHTSTDFGQNDEGMTSFDDCTKQRNLTDQGRAEARAIGAAIAKLHIPISEAVASPFCRTVETAKLVFGRATISNAVRGGPADNAERYAELRKLLSTPVPRGGNLAIASHGNPFRSVAGTPYLAEGESAVIEPLGNNRFRIVARITKDDWSKLGAS